LGRSEGANILFSVVDREEEIEVFTTRPDTLFGATFVTLAPEHPLSETLVVGTDYEEAWRALYDEVARMSEFDRIKNMNKKKGVFSGRYAIHPLTGEHVPIWIGNFVIASYGTGAVMAVPAHDERDFDFATEYGIPIRRVLVMAEDGDAAAPMAKAETDLGWMVNSPVEGFDGLYGQEAKRAVCQALEDAGRGHQTINWKVRPWLISRQRYWGTPIPVIHCESCGAVPVPERDLPVELPRDVVFGKGNPLESSLSFVHTPCPSCGGDARRETDTMDTFMDSSWYFLRYTDATNDDLPFEQAIADHWMQVDFYCGGIEHAQMHLIYARFMTKALRDLGLMNVSEPFYELLCQGMVNKSAPFCADCGVTLSVSHGGAPCPHCDGELGTRSAKMSKSLGNTVSPEEMIKRFGADTVRLFILFAANPTAGMDWSDAALEANHRVMLQLQTMPSQLMAWSGEATAMDEWMVARFTQRVLEFNDAMDAYDLRRAVEISHFDVIKDINWYVRRGGGCRQVAEDILPVWSQLISVSTPHLAEDWWAALDSTSGFVSASSLVVPEALSDEDQVLLAGEQYIRDVLEQARKVRVVAERHLGKTASHATFVTAPLWKRTMAQEALAFVADGGHPKQFLPVLQAMPMAQGERKGEMIGFWGKKMLPQVFKWDDVSRSVVRSTMDEEAVLSAASTFISTELGLENIEVVVGESDDDTTGRAGSAMPLSPSVIYA
jgi:leucyl-tRNA synthetase